MNLSTSSLELSTTAVEIPSGSIITKLLQYSNIKVKDTTFLVKLKSCFKIMIFREIDFLIFFSATTNDFQPPDFISAKTSPLFLSNFVVASLLQL